MEMPTTTSLGFDYDGKDRQPEAFLPGAKLLETVTDGTTEINRCYWVTLVKPDMVDDDGSPLTLDPFKVYLRYSHEAADALPASSERAKNEAARRACKLERFNFHTTGDLVAADVRYSGAKVVPARAKKVQP